MSAHSLHTNANLLDRSEVTLCVQPAINTYDNENAENYNVSKVWARATMIVNEDSSALASA
jgi:hypothetical protein